MQSPLSFLSITCGLAADEREETAVLQRFAVRGALAYLKGNPKCEFDSQQVAEIFEGILITGIQELEKEPIRFKDHEWKLHKRLSGQTESGERTDSKHVSKSLESKAGDAQNKRTVSRSQQIEEGTERSALTASTASGETSRSKSWEKDLVSDPDAFLDFAATSIDHRGAFDMVIEARSSTLLCQMLKRGWGPPDLLDMIAEKGWLEGLIVGLEHGGTFDKFTTPRAAVVNGHVDCLRYLCENGWKSSHDSKRSVLTAIAAENGHVECLRYLHKFGVPWCKEFTTSLAAKGGHLDCLRYAHEHGCRWGCKTPASAAEHGHLECLRYAHENGCRWDYITPMIAAQEGHLECLRYAHENGCRWNETVHRGAAGNGHMDCLRYLHENGCPWNEWTPEAAAKEGQTDCLRYLHENGCPWNEWTPKAAAG